ncbi:hypothetical protein BOO91_01685 [Vibrio navarrensis]|uniref:hypothetical protein n=1 Tax=Vibrio navarrensis TaxID=29495 RepID=UPI0018666CF0|nr:hypothetical protein [Vibrio navarrensis]MBE3659659.1 hypothetical protein [Vibrio navarrensis]
MLTVQRHYTVSGKPSLHTCVEVNPTGTVEIEVLELYQHHSSSFDNLSFKVNPQGVSVVCCHQASPWQLLLNSQDAQELRSLIQEAEEEYEILMRDL